jgi:autotransporter passenger strand-loop-strand repeat protein
MTTTIVSSGQSVTSQAIANGNALTVFGTATSTMISGGGLVSVSSGGVGIDTLVLSGGQDVVGLSGITSGTTISSGETEIVSVGGVSVGAMLSGGLETVYGVTSGLPIGIIGKTAR